MRVRDRARACARIASASIPGIGFGKTLEHNLELIRRLDVLLALGRPVLIGFSRKSSLRKLVGVRDDRSQRERRRRRRGLRARRNHPPCA